MQQFHSSGKLLLTGEYVILDGALSFAIPTKLGQKLEVKPFKKRAIHYNAYLEDKSLWFDCEVDLNNWMVLKSSDKDTANTLLEILKVCNTLNPAIFSRPNGWVLNTHLEFPRDWGLGSSSTFLNNLAKWLNINPFQLSNQTFGGSGYDIACANYTRPILYQRTNLIKPTVKTVEFNPSFRDQLYFVHLNKKQNSREGIRVYKNQPKNKSLIERVTQVTNQILQTNHLLEFESLLVEHEQLISMHLKIPTVKKQLFNDYSGVVKSLGAWGGDFVLVTSRRGFKSYLTKKGYNTILSYEELFGH